MKKTKACIYICDNEFFFLDKKKNEIKNQIFKSLKEEQILNSNLFVKELNKFISKNHISIPLFGYSIDFIIRKELDSTTKEMYLECFQDYFRSINIIYIEDLLKISKDTAYLNITNQYTDYYYEKKNHKFCIRIQNNIFNNNQKQIINHILTNIFKAEKIIIFGNTNDIPTIIKYINQIKNTSAIFSEFYKIYILEEYKKKIILYFFWFLCYNCK